MGRTKTSRYRNWRKQMRKRGQRPPRKRYTVQPDSKSNRSRPITREEPCTWDTPNAARETDPVLDRMEKAGDMIAQGLVTLLWVVVPAVVIAQVGFKFGWW